MFTIQYYPIIPLPHRADGDLVHVAVVEVLAGHTPDEHVVRGAGGGMDAPLGRGDRLFVVEPHETLLLRTASGGRLPGLQGR